MAAGTEKAWSLPAADIVESLAQSHEALLGYAKELLWLLPKVADGL
jgi:hypothetical protein